MQKVSFLCFTKLQKIKALTSFREEPFLQQLDGRKVLERISEKNADDQRHVHYSSQGASGREVLNQNLFCIGAIFQVANHSEPGHYSTSYVHSYSQQNIEIFPISFHTIFYWHHLKESFKKSIRNTGIFFRNIGLLLLKFHFFKISTRALFIRNLARLGSTHTS